MALFGSIEKRQLEQLWQTFSQQVLGRESITVGADGVARTKTIISPQMVTQFNWTSAPSMGAAGTTGAYSYTPATIGSHWFHGTIIIPDSWKSGTAITVDVGTGFSSGTGNVDFDMVASCHTHNPTTDPNNYLGHEYSTSRSTTDNQSDITMGSQTFLRVNGFTVTTDGTLGSGSIAAGDQLNIGFKISASATSGTTSTTAHASFIKVHYTATDYTEA